MYDKQNDFDELTHCVDQVFENINENLSVIKLAHSSKNLQILQNTLINNNEGINMYKINNLTDNNELEFDINTELEIN